MTTKSRPVLVTQAVLAALQVLTAGSVLADVIGAQLAALIVLGIAAVQTGAAIYVQGLVVPVSDVAAYTDGSQILVAGPAADQANGTPVTVETGA